MKQAHDELERRVEERTAELAEANRQLQHEVEERKAAEETLLQSRDELQIIYNEMVEGCLITDIETKRFVRVNSSFCRMLGYSEEELLAASLQDIHPPEEVTNDLQRFQQVAENQRSLNENRPVLRKDGTIFYADISGRRILYHGRPCVLALFRDVTERRQAQVALQESEEKYKTLVDTSPDVVIMADLTGHVSFVSRRLVELHGAESADEFLGKTAWDYLVPEDHEKYHHFLQKTLEDGITSDVEYTFIKKDGTRYPTELSAALVKDAAGKPVAIINVLRDITERKQAEKALRQSERRFRNYFEQGLIGMAMTSVDKRWLEVNDRLCEILGYSREELVRTSWAELTHPDDLEENRRLFNRLLVGDIENFTFDKRYIKKDGSIVYTTIYTRAFRKEDGTIDHIVLLVEDITARKQAEENLRASEERYELAVRGAGVGIWDWNIRTGKLYFSPRWKAIFGYGENDIGDGLDDWSRLLHPDEKDWMLKFLEDFLAGTSPTVTVEYRLRHKDGSYRWIVAHGIVLRDEQGKAYRFVGSHGDITDRKQAEEALDRERQTLVAHAPSQRPRTADHIL